jgi:hypothetical protein
MDMFTSFVLANAEVDFVPDSFRRLRFVAGLNVVRIPAIEQFLAES